MIFTFLLTVLVIISRQCGNEGRAIVIMLNENFYLSRCWAFFVCFKVIFSRCSLSIHQGLVKKSSYNFSKHEITCLKCEANTINHVLNFLTGRKIMNLQNISVFQVNTKFKIKSMSTNVNGNSTYSL